MNPLEVLFLGLTAIGISGNFTILGEKYIPSWIIHVWKHGRANKTPGKKWFVRRQEVPKSWFRHFYLYALILQFAMLVSILRIYTDPNPTVAAARSLPGQILTILGGPERPITIDSTTTTLATLLFFLQALRRFYESWFISVFSDTKMSVFHYLVGFIHYTGSSFSILAHSVGFAKGRSYLPPGENAWTVSLGALSMLHAAGIILFLYGYVEQFKAHWKFAELRKGKGNQVVSLAHRLPEGGLFEKVSCPNYWAEIVIYAAFCLLFSFRNPTWNYVFLWVLTNQVFCGIMNHQWYLKTFPKYPKSRKAVIPYIL